MGEGGAADGEGELRRAGDVFPKPPPKPRSGLCPEWLADFRIPNLLGALAGGAEGSFLCSPSSRFSGRGGGVGSLPRAWRRVGVPGAAGAKKKCVRLASAFSFAALSVFRLRRAEVASAVWIPHWHSEPCESQGARAAKGYVNGNLVEREKGD